MALSACLLIIEDDVGLARLLARHFERLGFTIATAETGAAGLARLDGATFDVVALDHNLPDASGLDILAAIGGRAQAPPVVFVTGSDDARTAVAALKAGAADYVVKTVGREFPALVEAAVISALERQALRGDKDRAVQDMLAAREQAEALAQQRAMLLREVNHRVANSLQLITSLAAMQERSSTVPEVRQALADMGALIQAISDVHRRLYTADDVRSVALDDYLRGLTTELGRSVPAQRVSEIKLVSDPVSVSTDKAVAVGMIVAELVTNAAKYAYPDPAVGEIRVALRRELADKLSLAVADDGVGYSPESQTKGLGYRVITAMARNLKGQLEFARPAQGTLTILRFRADASDAGPVLTAI